METKCNDEVSVFEFGWFLSCDNLNDLTYLIAKHLYFHMVLYVFFLTVVLCQTEILDLFEGNL